MKSTHPTGLGRSALQAYRLLLNEGGWWTLKEIAYAREIFVHNGLRDALKKLVDDLHVERRGSGSGCDPYRYGVTAKCKPVPYVTLDAAPNAEPKPAQPLRPATHPYFYN
jgi:hypothetical protein